MNISQCKEKCCGCGSCSIVCKKKAITMLKDKHGFIYPMIDEEKCIDCGSCVGHCPVSSTEKKDDLDKAFYGWNRDKEVRLKSSSGGVFSCLADETLKNGGIVFGAVFQNKDKSVNYRSTDRVNLDDLRRSKYTECQTGTVYEEVKDELTKGRKVLFCGTPCHVAGLKKFLAKEYDNLILCDFVCGGAASPNFLKEHLEKLENKYQSKVEKINFRDKKYGWKRMTLTVYFKNGKKKSSLSYFDSYFNGFVEGIIKRENCFKCPFADNHYGDITLADYWGYKQGGLQYDEAGISMVIAHTRKGEDFLKSITNKMFSVEMPSENTKYTVKKRVFNQEKYDKRQKFFELASHIGYEKAAKKTYMKSPLKDLLFEYLNIK